MSRQQTNSRRTPGDRLKDGLRWASMGLATGFLVLLPPKPASARALDTPQVELTRVGQLGGAALSVAVAGNRAFAGFGPRLAVLDVADPSRPRLLGQSPPLPGLIQDVAVDGRYAYAAGGFYGMAVIDVTDPALPQIVTTISPLGEQERSVAIALADRHAFLVSQSDDMTHMLRVYDLAQAAEPREVASFPNNAVATDIAVASGYAYVTTGSSAMSGGTLSVYQVRDPSQIDLVNVLHTADGLYGLALAGARAYAAAGDHGLVAIDLSDPSQPVEIGGARWSGDSRGIAVVGQTAYVAVQRYDDVGVDELRAVDITDPAAPRTLGRLDAAGTPQALAAAGGTVYLAAGGGGIETVGASDPAALRLLGRLDVSDYHGRVAVDGDLAFTADGISHFAGDRLAVIDLAAAGGQREVASVALRQLDRPPAILGLAAAGGLVFVATESADVGGGNALQVVELGDLSAPRLVAVLPLPGGGARDVAVNGSLVVVAGTGLALIDVGDPLSPHIIASLDSLPVGQAERVAIAGGIAYVVGVDGLATVDLRDPAAPTILGHTDQAGRARDLSLAAGRAAIVAEGFLIFADVSDPARPMAERWLEVIDMGARWGRWNARPRLTSVGHLDAGMPLTLSDAGELALIDARDIFDLEILQRLDLGGSGGGLAVTSGRAVAVSGPGGLSVLEGRGADSTPSATTSATPSATSATPTEPTPSPEPQPTAGWAPAGALLRPHIGHSATLLQDGTVLVAGGTTGGEWIVGGAAGRPSTAAGSEVYDPASGISRPVGAIALARMDHAAALLRDGTVLVAGGIDFTPPLDAVLHLTRSAERYDPTAGTWRPVGAMQVARTGHTLTRLADGRVLAVGGRGAADPRGGPIHADAEIYEPATGAWRPTGAMSHARAGHSATLLADGTVLVAGGAGRDGAEVAIAERYDPARGAWAPAGTLRQARRLHSATLLADGRVLVAGGSGDQDALATAELFDPATGAWIETGGLWVRRDNHSATLLADGRVLVAGGAAHGATDAADIYDPATGNWTQGPALLKGRAAHSATLLPGGRVLVIGGAGYVVPAVLMPALATVEMLQLLPTEPRLANSPPDFRGANSALVLADGRVLVVGAHGADFHLTADALLFDPVAETWQSTGAFNIARGGFSTTLLPSGEVLVAGGSDPQGQVLLSSAEIYDPAAGTWRRTGDMASARYGHSATLLRDGRVLVIDRGVAGGAGAEVYDPALGTWERIGGPRATRTWHSATLLADGRVLLVSEGTAELFDPTTGIWRRTAAPRWGYPGHSASLMPDGTVLVAGGQEILQGEGFPRTGDPERFDPKSERWRPAGDIAGHYSMSAVVLSSGQVVVAGGGRYTLSSRPFGEGEWAFHPADDLDLYDPAADAWRTIHLRITRSNPSATLLPDGRVLFLGGIGSIKASDDPGAPLLPAAELFDPRLPLSTAITRPVITGFSVAIAPGERLVIRGTGFTGGGEASGGNGAQSSATNHPLVQLRSLANSQMRYLLPDSEVAPASPSGWSDTTFTSRPITDFPPGPALVTVFVNGIQSDGRIIVVLPCAPGTSCAKPIPVAHTIFLPFATSPQASASQARRLTRSPRRDWQPAVSPDGRRVAYISEDIAADTVEMRILDLASGIDRALSIDGLVAAETPSFTSDGRRIVFAGRTNPQDEAPFRFPDWEVLGVDLDGDAGPYAQYSPADERRPSLVNDGLVCYDSERDGNQDIYCQNLENHVETRYTDYPGVDKHAAPLPGPFFGTLIMLYRSERDGDSDLFSLVSGAENQAVNRITHSPGFDGYPSMSPGGGALFQSRRSGREGVYALAHTWEDDRAPGNLRAIATGTADFVTPRFAPDGCWVALASNIGGDRENPDDLDVYLWPGGGCAP